VYLNFRNFAAMVENEAREARNEMLSVFDHRDAGAGAGGGEGEFGAADSDDSAISLKEAELERRVQELSLEQRDTYDGVVHYVSNRSELAPQLLMIIAGAAGVGKSKLLIAVVLYMRLQFGSKAVEVLAQTNAAAWLVDGHTMESACPKEITMRTSNDRGKLRQTKALEAFRARFANVRLIIFEENSLTPCEDLLHAHECFKLAFPERGDRPFAGCNVGLEIK
jgi:hypothetical protein